MANWGEKRRVFDGVDRKLSKKKRLKVALVSACAASSAVEHIIDLTPASFGLDTSRLQLTQHYNEKKRQEEDDELNSLFFHNAMLSASLALTADAGWWVKPRVPAWFDKFLLEVTDKESWLNALGMSKETFVWICNQLQPLLNKKVTRFRSPIPVPWRLGAALYRLTSGADLQAISEKFGIGVSSSQSCITDAVKAINQHFGSWLMFPEGKRLKEVISGFFDKCELVNCAGAIGTTNVQVMASSGEISGCSISLQAVCDTSYRFMDIYCGSSQQDGFRTQGVGLLKAEASLLSALPPDNSEVYYLVGGDKYPLLPWLLVRYQDSEMPVMAQSFNTRHALGLAYIQNSFGILKRTFKILSKCVKHNVNFVPKVITACCILQNILLDRNEIPVDSILQGLIVEEDNAMDHHCYQRGETNGGFTSPEEQQSQELRDQLAEMFFRRDL